MTPDPYSTLGVRRNASFETIKRAYRKLSKAAHPDTGGSADAFAKLKRAYDVLSDAERRAHYDQTGEIREPKPDNSDQAAWGIIQGMLAGLLGGADDPFGTDLVAVMCAALDKDIEVARKRIAVYERALTRVDRMQGRFTRGDAGENMIERMLEWHRGEIKRHIAGQREFIAQRERAVEMLQGYDFRVDRPDPAAMRWASQAYGVNTYCQTASAS